MPTPCMSTAEEWIKKDENLAKLATDFYAIQPGKDPWEEDGATPPPEPMQPPTEGFIKPGGWGANQDAKTWKSTSMKDKPEMFKVVDDADKNVATDFTTEDNANYYIEYYQWLEQNPEPEPEPGPDPTPAPRANLIKKACLCSILQSKAVRNTILKITSTSAQAMVKHQNQN